MLSAAPDMKPYAASNVADCTLNSLTTDWGGEYAICCPCMLLAPSTMNSLLPLRVPSIDMVDGEAVSNGRTYAADCGVNVTPGERVASSSTMPSLLGRSAMALLSMTCPIDAVEVSRIGVSPTT